MKRVLTTRFRRSRRDAAAPEIPDDPKTQARKRPMGGLQPGHLLLLR
ncbi:MAG: hypothetical protein KDK28_02030 [Maritimibacter sp.]|nr:hypothetical protein [Maritimibacter sp.]